MDSESLKLDLKRLIVRELDLRESLVRITGQIQVGELEKNLSDTLSEAGFLEDEKFEELRSKRTSSRGR